MVFRLIGKAAWEGVGRHDYCIDINEEIKAKDIKNAVKKAKEIIKEKDQEYSRYNGVGWPSDCDTEFALYQLARKIKRPKSR